MIIKPSNTLLAPGQENLVDSNRRRFMRTTALGAACMASAPLLASSGLVDMHGLPLTDASNTYRTGAKTLRESLLASLNLAPVVGGFLSYMGALFIPNPGMSIEQMWSNIIDARISDALYKLVQRDLVGLTDTVTLYRNAVAAQDRGEIRETSIAVNALFTALVPRFQISGQEVSLLPLFVMAATLHLSLLRDIALKGKEIGFNDASIANYQRELERKIDEHTRYVDRFVAQAIEKARRENPNGSIGAPRNQPLHAMLIAKANLQVDVLDVRDTWHAFDAIKFPGSTRLKLNREVFSGICGWWDSKSTAPSQLPDWKAPASSLSSIAIWDRSQWRTTFLSGFSAVYAAGTPVLETGEKIGWRTQFTLSQISISRVEGRFSAGIINMMFYYGASKPLQVGRSVDGNESHYAAGYADHRLSSLRSIGTGTSSAENCVSGCIFGFQLINQEARPVSAATFEQIAPTIAPHLLDWVAS